MTLELGVTLQGNPKACGGGVGPDHEFIFFLFVFG